MKIHINKEKVEKKGFFGKGKSWTIINAFYELNSEERTLLNSNKNLLGMTVFDLQFRGPDGVTSGDPARTVKQLTDEKYLKKGKQIAIEGRLETNAYDDKEGKRRFFTQVNVNDLVMLSKESN